MDAPLSDPQVLGDHLQAFFAFLLADSFVDMTEDALCGRERALCVDAIFLGVGVVKDLVTDTRQKQV